MAVRHTKGIHCIHIHGWNTVLWCLQCRNHLHNTIENPVADWADADFERYERQRDTELAHAVLAAMERGEIPISPLMADFDLTNVFESRVPEPSPN